MTKIVSKIKVPTSLRPYSIGYRVVSKNGNILSLRNGASVFSLPAEAKKSIQKEFKKENPDFDIEKYQVEEVAIINFEKLKNFLQEAENDAKICYYASRAFGRVGNVFENPELLEHPDFREANND